MVALNRQPVSAFNLDLRQALLGAIQAADDDPGVWVLHGSSHGFSAGQASRSSPPLKLARRLPLQGCVRTHRSRSRPVPGRRSGNCTCMPLADRVWRGTRRPAGGHSGLFTSVSNPALAAASWLALRGRSNCLRGAVRRALALAHAVKHRVDRLPVVDSGERAYVQSRRDSAVGWCAARSMQCWLLV